MDSFSHLWSRFIGFFQRRRLETEMADEMRQHLERRTQEKIADGHSPDEARYAAQREFGHVGSLQEAARDERRWIWLEQSAQDVRFAARSLLKHRGFTAVVILTLALGTGGTTAIYSVVRAVLWKALPYANPEQLVWVASSLRSQTKEAPLSVADFLDYREQSRSFAQLAASSGDGVPMNLTGAGEPERLLGAQVTANYLDVFGVRPALGRTFASDEDQAGRNQVVVLSHGLWLRRFGADPAILGRTIALDGTSVTVVGVMPAGFQFPADAELWKPSNFSPATIANRNLHSVRVIGRLKPGITLPQAGAEMRQLALTLAEQNPRTNTDWSVELTPLRNRLVGKVRLTLLVLFVSVAGVLLIACANVANLLLARGTARQKEIAVRAALGAGRGRIVRQLLTESLLLALLGSAAGLVLARWGVGLLVATGGASLPRADEIALDAPVLGFALLAALTTGLLFGLVPALQATQLDLNAALGDGGHAARGGSRRHRALRLLIVAEIALAAVLLIGAGLLVRSFVRLQQVDRGFDERSVLTARLDLTNPSLTSSQKVAFFEQLQARLAGLPAVETVGLVSELPLSAQAAGVLFKVEDRVGPNATSDGAADLRSVNQDYFRAMRMPLLRGRGFTFAEVHDSSRVMVISDVLARRFFPGEDPLGRRVRSDLLSKGTFEIVGIVGDVRDRSLAGDVQPTLYIPTLKTGWKNLVIRTVGDPATLVAAVRREVAALDPNQPLANVRTMEQWSAASLAQPRMRTWALGLFSAVALLISLLGIYGVMTYAVTQRTAEFGIRLALGATAQDIVGMVVRQGMRLALAGLAFGLLCAFALTRLLQSLLFGVGATDSPTFLSTTALMAFAAFLACWIPARRAAKVDPMVALRSE